MIMFYEKCNWLKHKECPSTLNYQPQKIKIPTFTSEMFTISLTNREQPLPLQEVETLLFAEGLVYRQQRGWDAEG